MRVKFLLVIGVCVLLGGIAACGAPVSANAPNLPGFDLGTTAPARASSVSHIGASEDVTAPVQTQGSTDLSLDDVIVTQAVYNEPLIFNKETVVRAVIGASGANAYQAKVTVEFDGKTYSETKPVQGKQTIVDVLVGAPQNFQTQTINVRVEPTAQVTDDDESNNSKSVTLPMVKPSERIVAYFLPVDWTDDQRQRYNFGVNFPKFVDENAIYLRSAYPLPRDQIVVDYSIVPHMLAAGEKRLANNQGDTDMVSSHLLYATISLAARRLKPDASLVVGVLPPGWFAAHGKRSTLGLALSDVKGTVTAQYVLTDATTSAHELAHLYWLYEDYDYSIQPPRPFTWLDRSGYFVEKRTPEEISASKQIPTFLSAYAPDKPSWVDTRIYEYLTAKFTIQNNGQVTEPMILAATIARQVEPDDKNYPSDYSAGWQRFEPKQTAYVSVGAAGMRGGETIEARWFLGDRQVFQDSKMAKPGDAWYAFSLRSKNGMPEGNYHVDIYLDGRLVKTSKFEVKSSQ
jgi:hypothetical protein